MNNVLYAAALVLFAIAGILWLTATPSTVEPMPLVPGREVSLEEYQRQDAPPESAGRYDREAVINAIRRTQAERAANPEGFRRWRECRERCGYAPRPEDPDGEVSAEYAAEIRRRRAACGRDACPYPVAR